MKRTQNILLLLTFIAAMLEPVTGIVIHKLSAASFLLMSMIHILVFFLAIHIFVFHKKICRKRRVSKKGL